MTKIYVVHSVNYSMKEDAMFQEGLIYDAGNCSAIELSSKIIELATEYGYILGVNPEDNEKILDDLLEEDFMNDYEGLWFHEFQAIWFLNEKIAKEGYKFRYGNNSEGFGYWKIKEEEE